MSRPIRELHSLLTYALHYPEEQKIWRALKKANPASQINTLSLPWDDENNVQNTEDKLEKNDFLKYLLRFVVLLFYPENYFGNS